MTPVETIARGLEDPRTAPGKTEDDPACIDYYCPSFLSCRRGISEPWQDGPCTHSFFSMPDKQLGGLICSWFQPANFNPVAKPVDATQVRAILEQERSDG